MNKFLKLPLFIGMLLFSATLLHAQLGIQIEMNHEDYMQYENVFVKVLIRNFSGHAIPFGEKSELQGDLKFDIIGPFGNYLLPVSKDETLIKGTIISPGATVKLVIPLFKYYDLHDIGKYRVKATVSHSLFNTPYESNTLSFKVSKGMTVWENMVGIPKLTDNDSKDPIKTVTYKILSHFDGTHQLFFLLIEDKQYVYSVKRIGYQMGGVVPHCEVDSLSRLHVMMQLSAKIFIYFLYNTNGELEKKDVFNKTSTSPSLIRDPETGEIIVAGGEKAQRGLDYKEDEEEDISFGNKKVDAKDKKQPSE